MPWLIRNQKTKLTKSIIEDVFTSYIHPMKYIAGIIAIAFFACKSSSGIGKNTSSYALVWSDEFNGSSLDQKNWNYNIGGHGWGNNEQEYYTDKNATVENGNLVITGKAETVDSNAYTSSRITTKGKHEFQYGKIEARMKIPTGQGLWPAFWMLGANIDQVNWPQCGEIDIMEHINSDSTFYGTLHWVNSQKVSSGNKTKAAPDDYHVYAIEWNADSISWLLDNKKYHSVEIKNNINSTEEFHKPFFILLNLAIAGDWPGQEVDQSKIPAQMIVDYVRVYQQK
jgi:beta-glucanase (GH16 family)